MSIRVLIADDEPPLLRMVVDLIRAHDGFEVTATAVDADEAAERAAETMPDVALLDVRMPGGGVSAARAIRSRSPHTHVVAHSAHHDTTLVLAMLRAGASGYVVKGAPPSELIAALEGAARGTTTLSGEAISGMVAELSGKRRETQRTANERGRLRREIRGVIDRCALTSALQPIFDLERLEPVGYEALARFPNHSTR
ncbi:MAG TPA: response regulator, partial [Gaiellales bacterium]|nr:response regulator [Gaiellales bacterium]